MGIEFRHVALLTLWTMGIGPVLNVQPSRDEGPRIEKRRPLKKEPTFKKALPLNPYLKQIK
jgi:hypothetical protein